MSYEERIYSLEKRKLRVSLITLCNSLRWEGAEGVAIPFSLVSDVIMPMNGPKLCQKKLKLIKHRNKLPTEVVDTSFSSVFKRHLDNTLSIF